MRLIPYVIAVILLSLSHSFGQVAPVTIERGKLVERFATAADPAQTYAVYLPSTYDPKNKYPAVFCFDASGRGARAAEVLRLAAEKYGYLVFASNNSRNGISDAAITTILNAIWKDTNERFSIDRRSVLATGNSGGARVASAFAYFCRGCVFGVIGCGAGFSSSVPVNKTLPFIFLATAGRDDFNYPEVRELEKKLNKASVVNRVVVFEGGHQWAPPDVVDHAVAWMEIQRMRTGRRAKDASLVDDLYTKRMMHASKMVADSDLFAAASEFSSIVADFQGMHATTEPASQLANIERSPEYKKARKAEGDLIKKQQEVTTQIKALANDLLDDSTRASALSRIRGRIAKLREQAAQQADSGDRRFARRTLNQLFVDTFETALYRHEREAQYEVALANLEIAAEASPKFASIPYSQARIAALAGHKTKAIEFLLKAIELGFGNVREIAGEKAFDSIRSDDRLVKAVNALSSRRST